MQSKGVRYETFVKDTCYFDDYLRQLTWFIISAYHLFGQCFKIQRHGSDLAVYFFRHFFARGVHCFQFSAQGSGGVGKPETTKQH